MRKTFFIFLAIIYLASSAGATVQFHYCMDRLVGIGMHETENDMCAKCGMKKQEGCCKDESKQIKVADDQKPASKFVLNTAAVEHEARVNVNEPGTFSVLKGLSFQPSTNGPPNHGIERYKLLRVFRI